MINLNIQKALIFAACKHRMQTRKTTDIPYIVHPAECMQILTEMGCPEDVIIAGILHDTLEDTKTTKEEIIENFGEKIAGYVTKESEDKSKTWKERKSYTIEHLQTESNEIKLIAFADKLSNIRSIYRDSLEIGEKVWERFNATKEEEKWYYESLGNIFSKTEIQKEMDLKASRNLFSEYKEILTKLFNNLTNQK